jgi:hypothetical protein
MLSHRRKMSLAAAGISIAVLEDPGRGTAFYSALRTSTEKIHRRNSGGGSEFRKVPSSPTTCKRYWGYLSPGQGTPQLAFRRCAFFKSSTQGTETQIAITKGNRKARKVKMYVTHTPASVYACPPCGLICGDFSSVVLLICRPFVRRIGWLCWFRPSLS